MPQDPLDNINSKEKRTDSAQEDFAALIEATKDLKISLDNFTVALEKVHRSKSSIPDPTYSSNVAGQAATVVKLASKYSYFHEGPFTSIEQKHGFRVNEIIKVKNVIKSDGYVIPEEEKYGKVTRFNDKYVFFNINYFKDNVWYSYEAWRAPHNISHAPSHKWKHGNRSC